MSESALSSITRAVRSVPTMAMRRAVLEEKLLALSPGDAAAAIEALAIAAQSGDAAARIALVALASAFVLRRRADGVAGVDADGAAVDAIAVAAGEQGNALADRICANTGSAKSLPLRGHLPEVGLNREGYFPTRLPPRMGDFGEPHVKSFQRFASRGFALVGNDLKRLDAVLFCPSGAFVERLLRAPWVRLQEVLRIAARRPSTPEIILAIAASDRWFQEPRVRAALAANPFTPSWLTAAIELTVAGASARREHREPAAHDAL